MFWKFNKCVKKISLALGKLYIFFIKWGPMGSSLRMLQNSKLICITHIKVQESYAIKEGAKMLCNKCSFIRNFRRGILLHNIPSNDNKNARKIKIQAKTHVTTMFQALFITNIIYLFCCKVLISFKLKKTNILEFKSASFYEYF